jgi:membrane protease YdiL (CAAX protease family)
MVEPTSYLKNPGIFKAILFCAICAGFLKLLSYLSSSISGLNNGFLSSSLAVGTTLLITFLFLRFDKKRFSDIGLRFDKSTFKKFFAGFIIGVLVIFLLILGVAHLSEYKIEPNTNANVKFLLTLSLPITFLLAYMEEVAFRAYPLVTLRKRIGWVGAIIAMPTGVHTSMNLTQAVFGLTGNSFCIWNLVDKNGIQIKDFSSVQVFVTLAQVILAAIAIIVVWIAMRHKEK